MNEGLTAIEDLPDETRKIALKALQFREQNITSMRQIESHGGAVEIVNARLEHLVTSLVTLGVITEQAMWQIHLDWEKALRPQLLMQIKALQQVEQDRLRQLRQRRLIVPGRNGDKDDY